MTRPAHTTRRLLRARDGDLCCWCHEPMVFCRRKGPKSGACPPDMATIEHVIPKALGGSRKGLDNLALSHQRCNSARNGIARPPLPQIEARP